MGSAQPDGIGVTMAQGCWTIENILRDYVQSKILGRHSLSWLLDWFLKVCEQGGRSVPIANDLSRALRLGYMLDVSNISSIEGAIKSLVLFS